MKKRALLSVSDKTGLVDFAKGLSALDYELVSTGGTAKALREAGLSVVDVSEITGFPECLDGRVKTLHPMVHGGLLAMRENPDHLAQIERLGITPIDVVVCNLYPFKATILKEGVTFEEAIENIDIGGPTMIRSAAKNWQDVVVLIDPKDYDSVLADLKAGGVSKTRKLELACKVFEQIANYDAMIADYMRSVTHAAALPETLTLTYELAQPMRYGENPHQQAAFYREVMPVRGALTEAKQLHGKELSFNNISDANAALQTLSEFGTEEPAAVALKHANPCGVGVGKTLHEAYCNAYEGDPVSIFGGIVALNREVDAATAEEMAKIFLEIIIAPAFSAEALEILTKKKNIRLLELTGCGEPFPADMLDFKRVAGGMLAQTIDGKLLSEEEPRCVTDRAPTDEELKQLLFAWKVVKNVKSNGIVLAKEGRTVGVGPGQTNRVTALDLAIRYAGEKAKGSVMASDAFFPFSDCVEHAAEAGITAIIQPGGSVRDEESIKACNEAGIAMIFTGMRHFKH